VLVFHEGSRYRSSPDNANTFLALVVDGNHRVTVLKRLHNSASAKDKEKYRYIRGVVLHPSTPMDAIQRLGTGNVLSHGSTVTVHLGCYFRSAQQTEQCQTQVLRSLHLLDVVGSEEEILQCYDQSQHSYGA